MGTGPYTRMHNPERRKRRKERRRILTTAQVSIDRQILRREGSRIRGECVREGSGRLMSRGMGDVR